MRGDHPQARSYIGSEGGGAATRARDALASDASAIADGAAAEHAGAADASDAPDSIAAVHGQAKSWRNLWQMPTIILSVAMIVIGLRSAIRPPAPDDFAGALDQIEQFIAAGEIDPAFKQLREAIEPNLEKATIAEQARFHAISGDLTFASQHITSQNSDDNNRHIAEQYAAAEELGLELSAARIERWGEALLNLRDFAGTRDKLADLRAMAAADRPAAAAGTTATEAHAPDEHADEHGEDHADGHDQAQVVITEHDDGASEHAAAALGAARLFRHIIEGQLASPDLEADGLMEMLAEYRMTQSLTPGDEAWVAARLAELRLETDKPALAVDGLLVEMRRIEGGASDNIEHDSRGSAPVGFGQLYALLGRGYLEMGETDIARQHLDRALQLLEPSEPARGDVLALLGQIDLARHEHDAAYERFNAVAEEFVGTRSHLPGVLGRAQVQSLLGDHAASQADFREVEALLGRSQPRRDITPALVAQRLCDRHDAALALGKIDRALEYARIAELFFTDDSVPQDVLFRLASTNRQIAENLLASLGVKASDGEEVNPDDLDPAVRYEAHKRFEQAGNDYLRHVAARSVTPLSEEDWGASLWAAADCFDRAGLHTRAINEFEKYLGSRAPDDARRAEAMFRIAQAHHARMEHEQAAERYQQVLADRSRSSFAARCYVPLARCQLALGRIAEARQTLQQVLAGERLLDPDARDYRDALIELGRIHHDQGEFTSAIERLTETQQRYPTDPRRAEIDFLLADSYRGSALAIGQRLSDDSGLSPIEAGRLSALRSEHLQRGLDLFASICERFAGSAGHSTPASVSELVRRAHFYQADCAFELAQHDHAIELYEMASRQYAGGASSMYALVQIVNCYSALGDGERAAAAHQRALLRLRQLPDSAFAAADALMDRAAWERWLSNTPAGPAIASAETD